MTLCPGVSWVLPAWGPFDALVRTGTNGGPGRWQGRGTSRTRGRGYVPPLPGRERAVGHRRNGVWSARAPRRGQDVDRRHGERTLKRMLGPVEVLMAATAQEAAQGPSNARGRSLSLRSLCLPSCRWWRMAVMPPSGVASAVPLPARVPLDGGGRGTVPRLSAADRCGRGSGA